MDALDVDVAALVERAANRDSNAWATLVDLYGGLVWRVARSHRLREADSADVSQTTWLRLLEHIDRLDDPCRVGAWLATTARRESLRIIGLGHRQTLLAEGGSFDSVPDTAAALDADLLTVERNEMLERALSRLPERSQQLLRILNEDNGLHYQDVSAILDMPIGSIGPTRARCLRKLREIMEELESEPSRVPAGT